MEPFQLAESDILFIKKWQSEIPGLKAGFTTKNGGVSEPPFTSLNLGLHVDDKKESVITNRKLTADIIGRPIDDWIFCEQVHDKNIAVVTSSDKGKGVFNKEDALSNVDGLLSNDPSVMTAAFYADCVPLFFLDPVNKWFGIAHAGWKGTVLGIGREMVQLLVKQGSQIKNVKIAIGPSISKDSYEVDDRVIRNIPKKWQDKVVTEQEEGKYLLDLKLLNKIVLLEEGIKEENIEISSLCTFQEDDLFFSHRRDDGKTGRMIGFIGFA